MGNCWLCENANSNKLIGYCGDDSFSIGRDKTNEVGFWTTTRYGVVCTYNKVYSPKFCPECGRNLTDDTEGKIITYGVISNGTFYAILEHDNYYSFWFVDEVPTDITLNGIKYFMKRNSLDGCSTSGTYEEIMNDLKEYITDLT